MFDAPSEVHWARSRSAMLDSAAHRALALQAARESIVLLKNEGNTLPLWKSSRPSR